MGRLPDSLKGALWGDAGAVVTVQVSRHPVWRTLPPRPHCHSHQTMSFLSLIGTWSQQPTKIKICLPQVSWYERKHAFQTRTKLSHSPAVNGPGLHAASPAYSSCLQVMEQGRVGPMAFWSAQLSWCAVCATSPSTLNSFPSLPPAPR